MPQRAMGLLLALAGLAALVAFGLLGMSVHRAARTGPRWKRRLLGAGLVLLASLGLAPAAEREAPGAAANEAAATAAMPAEATAEMPKEWKHLTEVWREAEEVGSGRRGAYPFDRAGQKKLLAGLAALSADIQAMQNKGQLSEAEAGILLKDLPRLITGVQEKRPVEMRMATCYEPMMWTPAQDGLKRLGDRLPLLEKLAESKTVRPEVIYRILGAIEQDLAVLSDPKAIEALPEMDRPEAAKVRDAAKAAVDKIRERARGDVKDLSESQGWKTIQEAWKTTKPLEGSSSTTTKQRQAADALLARADAAARELAVEGLLSVPEAELVALESQRIQRAMYRNPPQELAAMCYGVPQFMPARDSMERLTARLPLLQKMAALGKIRPEVAQKVLPTVEADLKVLGDDRFLADLRKDAQVEVRQLKPQVERAIQQIRALAEKKE